MTVQRQAKRMFPGSTVAPRVATPVQYRVETPVKRTTYPLLAMLPAANVLYARFDEDRLYGSDQVFPSPLNDFVDPIFNLTGGGSDGSNQWVMAVNFTDNKIYLYRLSYDATRFIALYDTGWDPGLIDLNDLGKGVTAGPTKVVLQANGGAGVGADNDLNVKVFDIATTTVTDSWTFTGIGHLDEAPSTFALSRDETLAYTVVFDSGVDHSLLYAIDLSTGTPTLVFDMDSVLTAAGAITPSAAACPVPGGDFMLATLNMEMIRATSTGTLVWYRLRHTPVLGSYYSATISPDGEHVWGAVSGNLPPYPNYGGADLWTLDGRLQRVIGLPSAVQSPFVLWTDPVRR